MNHQDISSFIWKVADNVLRGLSRPHEYGDVILPIVVLRRLDCVLEPLNSDIQAAVEYTAWGNIKKGNY